MDLGSHKQKCESQICVVLNNLVILSERQLPLCNSDGWDGHGRQVTESKEKAEQ